MTTPADDKPIAVVGGGSTGASTAYHLAKAGRRVVLVEKGQIGSGMTSRSSAIVRTHYSNEVVARMALYSLERLRDFAEIGDSWFVQTGLLILSPAELRDGLIANVGMLNAIGARNEVLDKEEARRMFPELSYDDADYIVLEPQSGYADSAAVASAYARAAERLGANVLSQNEVTRLNTADGAVESISLSDGGTIHCSKAILCTNVWTNRLLAESGVEVSRETFPLWTVAHPIVCFKRPNAFQGVRPVIWDYPSKMYYKPEGQSLFFVGSLDPALDQKAIEPEECPASVPFEFTSASSEAVTRRIPLMTEGSFHSEYVGMYDVTPDQHPIIDGLSDLGLNGAYCCVGLNGHGFKLCPALGRMNAEMVLGQEGAVDPVFERSGFSLSRFKSGKMIRSKYATLATVA